MCDKSGTDLLSGHCDGSFPAPLSGQLAARKNSRVVRWYVLTLPVCHRGPAPGLRQEQERRLRSGEPPFEFFAPSYVEVRHENGRPVNTRRPLLYNYVFIRSSENELFRLKRQLPQYNFLPRVRDGREEYYPYLSDEAMRNLQWVARAYSDELPVYVPEAPQPVKGDRVRITSGRFKGVEARVAVRPGGGRREIVVCVENWMWVPLLHVRPGEYEVIGLHEAGKRVYESLDNDRLLETLTRLRDIGNTVIVVEHDEDAIRAADYLVDMGPGAGELGGHVVAKGTVEEVLNTPESLTAQYLTGQREISVPRKRRKGNGGFITLSGVKTNNLKDVDLKIPLGTMTCVTGVSGGGKSSLILETLFKAVNKELNGSREPAGIYDKLTGLENIDKVIDIDQSPIGRTPRSNPATYTGLFTYIRDWFAGLPEAKARGYNAGRFSFNVAGGRCEACKGDGVTKIEMHFLPDVYVACDVCKGKRFNRETLEVKYKGKSIADVLDMTVDEAFDFFDSIPSIKNRLDLLRKVGLGYIHLGQPATTLSGGEAQRIKLSKELSKRATGKTLYILDEPTTGLHFEDINRLLKVLQTLVDQGNTVVVIEHNLDVIKVADYIVDLGPEGGDGGGTIVTEGTPEQVARCEQSWTGKFLRDML